MMVFGITERYNFLHMANHKNEHAKLVETYKTLVQRTGYHPAGRTGTALDKEASEFAQKFIDEENSGSFAIGVSDFSTGPALMLSVLAARLLCARRTKLAAQLLGLAVEEAKAAPDTEDDLHS